MGMARIKRMVLMKRKTVKKQTMAFLLLGLLVGCEQKKEISIGTQSTLKCNREEKNIINCNLLENDVLEITGTGKITEKQLEKQLFDSSINYEEIKKLKIGDGITAIGEYAFAKWEIQEVKIASSVKVLEKGAFYSCEKLTKLSLTDGVEEIKESALEGCVSLKELELPKSLKKFDRTAIMYCSSLIKINNQSAFEYDLCYTGMIKGDWYSDGKIVDDILPNKTIEIKPQKYKIIYDLNGGVVIKPLPSSYKHTVGCQLPRTVKREGYDLLCWYDVKKNFWVDTIKCGTTEDKKFKAWWIDLKLENVGKGKICVTPDLLADKSKDFVFIHIRYSGNKDMSDAIWIRATSEGENKIQIKKLKSGKKYYFQCAITNDIETDWEQEDLNWTKPKSIVVE